MWIKQTLSIQLLFTTTILFFCLNSQQVHAEQSTCLGCHQEIKEIATEKYYIHRPVQEERCNICHDNNATEQLPSPHKDHTTPVIH